MLARAYMHTCLYARSLICAFAYMRGRLSSTRLISGVFRPDSTLPGSPSGSTGATIRTRTSRVNRWMSAFRPAAPRPDIRLYRGHHPYSMWIGLAKKRVSPFGPTQSTMAGLRRLPAGFVVSRTSTRSRWRRVGRSRSAARRSSRQCPCSSPEACSGPRRGGAVGR